MKKSVALLAILVSVGGLAVAQDLAVGPLVSVLVESQKVDGELATRSTATVGAIVPIYLKSGFELAPEASVTFYSEEDPAGIAAWGDNVDRLDFSLGAGALWTMSGSGVFSFKTGLHGLLTIIGEETPSGYDSYFHPVISLTLPLVIDLALGKSMVMRIEQPVATLAWDAAFYKQTILTVTTEYTDSSFSLDTFHDGLLPRFSFIIKL